VFKDKLDALLEAKRQLASDMLNGTSDIELAEWNGLGAPDGGPLITRVLLDADI